MVEVRKTMVQLPQPMPNVARVLSYQNTWNNFHQSSVSRRACRAYRQ